MRPRILPTSFLLALALLPPSLLAQTRSQISSVTETPPNARDQQISSTVPYAGSPSDPLTLDVYKLSGPGPHPAVIIIHGGGFLHGTSRNGSEAYAADFLAPAGFAVFSINYRLATASGTGGATFADMLADVQRAIRFVRHNAAEYQVDPNKIAVLGGSAGGYLSNLVGVSKPSALVTSADPVDRETDAVEAVVTLYGISDLSTMPHPTEFSEHGLLGTSTLSTASPLNLVRPYDPPFLFIHGDKDTSVPIDQSIRFEAALEAAGVRAELITVPGAPHATGSWHTLPNVPDWEKQTITFLNQVLDHTGPNTGAGIAPRTSATTAPTPATQAPAAL